MEEGRLSSVASMVDSIHPSQGTTQSASRVPRTLHQPTLQSALPEQKQCSHELAEKPKCRGPSRSLGSQEAFTVSAGAICLESWGAQLQVRFLHLQAFASPSEPHLLHASLDRSLQEESGHAAADAIWQKPQSLDTPLQQLVENKFINRQFGRCTRGHTCHVCAMTSAQRWGQETHSLVHVTWFPEDHGVQCHGASCPDLPPFPDHLLHCTENPRVSDGKANQETQPRGHGIQPGPGDARISLQP